MNIIQCLENIHTYIIYVFFQLYTFIRKFVIYILIVFLNYKLKSNFSIFLIVFLIDFNIIKI